MTKNILVVIQEQGIKNQYEFEGDPDKIASVAFQFSKVFPKHVFVYKYANKEENFSGVERYENGVQTGFLAGSFTDYPLNSTILED